MSYVAGFGAGGVDPMQDFEGFAQGVRIEHLEIRQAGRFEREAENDIHPGFATRGHYMGIGDWQPEDIEARPPMWTFAVAQAEIDGGTIPVRGPLWDELEAEYVTREPVFPHEQRYPIGWSSVGLYGIAYDEQHALAAPNFDGIVTQHWSDFDLGSPWWDARDGELDEKYRSRTQSLARVVRPPLSGCYATDEPLLALQLEGSPSPSGRGENRFIGGFVCDLLAAGGRKGRSSTTFDPNSRPQAIGALSFRRGGPLMVHSLNCQHIEGMNDDGEPFGPVHIWIGALFSDPANFRDGPLDFELQRYDPSAGDFPHKTRGHIRFDPLAPHDSLCGEYRGRWRIESSTHIGEVKKKKDPPPDPPPGEPPPPTGGPVVPIPDPVIPPLDDPLGRDPFGGPDSGRPLTSRIGDAFVLRSLYGSSMETATPALVWHAHSFCDEAEDTRSTTSLTATGFAEWASRPAALRTEAYAKQLDCAFVTTNATDADRLRYLEVDTASGGVVDMPPELGIERVAEWEAEGSPLAASLSTSYRVLWETRLAFGTPLVSTGGVKNGWVNRLNGTLLDWSSADSSGTESQVMTLRTSGILGLRNTGGFTSLIRPDNLTASRSHYLPDKDGTLGLKLAVSVETGGAFTAAPDEAYVVDTSGGGVEVTLPAISAANEGCRIVISREGASDVTIVVSGSDTVLGDTSLTLATDYSSINLVAVYNGGTSPRWISQ